MFKFVKTFALAITLLGGIAFALPSIVDAKPGSGRPSIGSKGGMSGQAAPPTNTTAPHMNNSAPSQNAQARAPEPAKPSFMSRFGTGIAAGLLGAGLFGLLSGAGFGGMGGMLGLLLQLALAFFAVRFLLRFFRKAPEPAYGTGYNARVNATQTNYTAPAAPLAPVRANKDEVGITADDFNNFEQRLGQVQDAYGREALEELRPLITPEMHKIFSDDIAENIRKGVHNACGGAKLLQGDLAESWKEGASDYASVAMRYSLFDVTKNRTDGRVLEGSMTTPLEITQVWTFVRFNHGAWMLSAIEEP